MLDTIRRAKQKEVDVLQRRTSIKVLERVIGEIAPPLDVLSHLKRGDRNVKLKASTCLSCSRPFMSAGNHNRVCKACKSCGAWASGNDYEAMI